MARVQVNYSKKDGTLLNYKFIALLGRDESGKQIQLSKRVQSEGGTPKAELKKMQRLADDWEEQERAEYEKNRGRESEEKKIAKKEKDKITLEDFIDKKWIPKHVKNGVHTPDTIAFYGHMSDDIKAYFKEKAPGLKLCQIDKEDVLDYLTYLRNEATTKRGQPLGATTIQHHFSTLRNILEYAVYVEYIKEDPCKKIKPTDRPKREEREIEFLDEDEAIRFMAALDSEAEKEYWKKTQYTYLMWKALCNALILTGLRRGELVGLKFEDLDEKKKILHVRRNVTADNSSKGNKEAKPEDRIHVGETKGKSVRKVPISSYLLTLFTDLKEERKKEIGAEILPTAYIFSRVDNPYLPIYPTEPTRLMKKFIERHNLKDVSPHDLRHTAASLAIENGANVKEIQKLLGHKDAATTIKFYTGITEKAARGTVEGIESKLRPQPKEEEKAT